MKLVEQQSVELDPAKRAQILSEIVKILHDDYAYIWLDQPVNIHFEHTWVHGWYWNPAIDVNYYATVYKE
jgi:ABC-type transport system substrate-binding protein